MTRRVICLSGGLDSAVLAYQWHKESELHAIGFHYGQSHYKENDAARRIATKLDIPFLLFDFQPVVARGKDSLTGGEGSPVVANRNATMLTLAATYGEGIGADYVLFAPTAEDFTLFPDCRFDFVESVNEMLFVGGCKIRENTPFINNTKAEVVAIGKKLGVPFEETWSCYAGGKEPCGKCLACTTREEALECLK